MLPHVMHNKTTTHPCGGTTPIALPNPKNDVVSAPIPSLPPYHHHHDHRHRLAVASSTIIPPFMVTAVAATSSWLRHRRIRYLFLLLCSPVLLCLFCAALPFLCAVDLCVRRRVWRKFFRDSAGGGGGGDDERLRRCEEGCCGGDDEEKGLLHRYLEDQLLLVGSMYECGDDDDEEGEEEFRRVEDVENQGSSMTPLLC